MTLEQTAKLVAGNLEQEEYQFDPSIILLIMGIIADLIPMLQDMCNKTPEETIDIARKPNFFQRRVIAWKTRRILGRQIYRETGPEVVDSLFKTAAESSVDDITNLYNYVE